MSRQPHQAVEIIVDSATPLPQGHQQFLADEATAKGLIAQSLDNATVLADRLGYDGPLTLGGAEDHARTQMRRTVNECLELGKTLLIIKELAPHGEFKQRIELLGISGRMAQKFMSATLKFSNANSNSLLNAVGGQTKLLELLVLDDTEIEMLENGESARGLKLDDIESMSVSELKKALKDARETTDARDTLVKNKQTRLDALEEENHKLKRRVETTTPAEAALEIRKEADRIAFIAEHDIRANLRKAFDALIEHGGVHQHSEFMLGLITQIELAADVLRADFGLLKAGPDGDSTPFWERQAAPAGVN